MRTIWIVVVMLAVSGHLGYGQDVTLVMDTCYNTGDTMPLEARYTGSKTILNVEWYITGATMTFTMYISICLPFGTPDLAFPTSRMTYGCPETAGANTFRINVAGLVKTDFNKEWGAKFILTTGHTTSLLRKTVTQCVQVATVTLYNEGLKPTSDQFIEVTDGVEKTLTCAPGTSIPAATISWYIGTKKLATSGTSLIFTPTNDNHNKTVHCKAYNLQPESQAVSSNTPSLYVNVPARTPTLANKTTSGNLVVLSGEETHLICITSATRPSSSVIWKKGKNSFGTERNTEHFEDGGLISVTSVVKFIPENIDNNVVITCETSISVQTTIQSVQQTIEVWWPPLQPTLIPTPTFPWLEKQTGNYLTCTSSNYGNPESTAYWTSQYGTPDDTNRRITFLELSAEQHNSTVTCGLGNGFSQRKVVTILSQAIRFDIQYKPVVKTELNGDDKQAVTVNEGQYLRAFCTADGNPVPTVQWIGRDGTADGVLKFTDIDRSDDRQYLCRTSAYSTSYPRYSFVTEKTLEVTVNYAPDVDAVLSTSRLIENSSVRATCKATGRPNDYAYIALEQTWMGTVIHNTHSHIPGTETYSSLDIASLQLHDTGNYTCYVNNGVPDRSGMLDQTATVNIKVEVSPKILPQQVAFAGAKSGDVNISVPFYSYPTATAVEFTKGVGVKIQNDNRSTVSYPVAQVKTQFFGTDVILNGNKALLQITNLQETDFTNYTLYITNSIGKSEQTIVLIIAVDESSLQGQSSGAIVGGVIGGLVVVVVALVVIAVLLTRKYQLECPCHRKNENPDDLKPVRDGVISTERNMSTPDSMSYYNAVDLSDPSSQYTTLTNRESASNNYDSLQIIELQETRPSTTIYENLKM